MSKQRNESSAAQDLPMHCCRSHANGLGFHGPDCLRKEREEQQSAAQDLGNCEEMVWVKPGYWHKFPCTRAAKREVDGRRLCTQHAKVAERRKELHTGEALLALEELETRWDQ